MNIYSALAGILSGVIGSMGLGGGGVLVLYLTLALNMPQLQAQGVNLIFFIPCAVVSLIIHAKNGLVKWKLALPLAALGSAGVLLGFFLVDKIPVAMLSKAFALFILFLGIKEFFPTKSSHKTAA